MLDRSDDILAVNTWQCAQSIVFALLLFVSLRAFASEEYRVESVEDGDTLVVYKEGDRSAAEPGHKIQLMGIDAPEDTSNPKLEFDLQRTGLDQQQLLVIGSAATNYLSSLLPEGSSINLDADPGAPDRYGRIPALIYTDSLPGTSINAQMIASGFAKYLDTDGLGASFSREFALLQQQAMSLKLGLWGEHRSITELWSGKQ